MPRTCTICIHPSLKSIDHALIAGAAYRSVTERYEASPPSVYRHQQGHLPGTLMKAQDAKEVAHADSLLEQLRRLQIETLGILTRAEEAGDLKTALTAIREARGTVELVAKLTAGVSNRPEMQRSNPYSELTVEELRALVACADEAQHGGGKQDHNTVEAVGYVLAR